MAKTKQIPILGSKELTKGDIRGKALKQLGLKE